MMELRLSPLMTHMVKAHSEVVATVEPLLGIAKVALVEPLLRTAIMVVPLPNTAAVAMAAALHLPDLHRLVLVSLASRHRPALAPLAGVHTATIAADDDQGIAAAAAAADMDTEGMAVMMTNFKVFFRVVGTYQQLMADAKG